MPQIKFDVSSEEAGAAQTGEQPKPGVYDGELMEINVRTDRGPGKGDDLECIYAILGEDGKPNTKLSRVWDYVGYQAENTQWKFAQFLEAIGEADENNRSGAFDPEEHARKVNGKETNLTMGTKVKLRIKADSYNGEYKGKIAAVLPHPDNDGSGGDANDPFA